MKITIITPTFNRTTFLNETIESIITQKGDFELEYIIQDGGSDETLINILKNWDEKIKTGQVEIGCKHLDFAYYVEKDSGMYDAINRGFAKATGDVMAWLNSDDMYHPYALQSVMQIFQSFSDVEWISGIPNSYNHFGARGGFDSFPPAYSQTYIAQGFHKMRNLKYGFNWIQQESTFWRRSLWERAGGSVDDTYKYAADFHLWLTFAKYADLVKVNSFLGGYRVHDDQFTADPSLYNSELPKHVEPPAGLLKLKEHLAKFPHLHKEIYSNKALIEKTFALHKNDLYGRAIKWSYPEKKWIIETKEIL